MSGSRFVYGIKRGYGPHWLHRTIQHVQFRPEQNDSRMCASNDVNYIMFFCWLTREK